MTLRPAPAVPCGTIRASAAPARSAKPAQPAPQYKSILARLLAPLVFIR